MPKDPKGRKRPADVIGNAVHVMRIATGEIAVLPDARNPQAVMRGKAGGRKRAQSLPAKKRREIATKAAEARWRKVR
jgi:hypothetical protein